METGISQSRAGFCYGPAAPGPLHPNSSAQIPFYSLKCMNNKIVQLEWEIFRFELESEPSLLNEKLFFSQGE